MLDLQIIFLIKFSQVCTGIFLCEQKYSWQLKKVPIVACTGKHLFEILDVNVPFHLLVC